MNWMEAALLVLGVGAFIASFVIPEKKNARDLESEIDPEIIRKLIEHEMKNAKSRVSEVVDETLEYAVEKTERACERISNEKIMAINEYSDTVLKDMNKTHQEIMFLYDMLNDKQKNLKETAIQVDKQTKEAASVLAAKEEAKVLQPLQPERAVPKVAAEKARAKQQKQPAQDNRITLDMLTSVITPENPRTESVPAGNMHTETIPVQTAASESKNVEVYSFVNQVPHVDRPQKKEAQAELLEHTVAMRKEAQRPAQPENRNVENNNDKILRMHKEGRDTVEIAKELGLGVGEVKLVINLFKGA